MELVIPLIEESLQPPAKEYFEEDGLILYVYISDAADGRWAKSLHNATSYNHPSPEKGLIRLLPGLMGMVGENLDLLVTSLDLLDSYLLLDAAGILQVCPRHSMGNAADDRSTAQTSVRPSTKLSPLRNSPLPNSTESSPPSLSSSVHLHFLLSLTCCWTRVSSSTH